MYPRYIERQLKDALSDTRVALISGPRQSGKTTLAQKLAHDEMPFLTLDDETTLESCTSSTPGCWQRCEASLPSAYNRIANRSERC